MQRFQVCKSFPFLADFVLVLAVETRSLVLGAPTVVRGLSLVVPSVRRLSEVMISFEYLP